MSDIKLREAAQRLLDWLYIFRLPDTESGRVTLAAYLNALQEAVGPRAPAASQESRHQ